MLSLHITALSGREILDSRGNPTLEARVQLSDGTTARASVPSGASTGRLEAKEWRDGDPARYGGRGVLQAAAALSREILPAVQHIDVREQAALDAALCALDGTPDKHRLGANALLAVSAAAARAAAHAQGKQLWQTCGDADPRTLPVPAFNLLNGGLHAPNPLDVQEFLVVPAGASCFAEALRWGSEIHHALGALLRREGLAAGVGDEGGFAPDLTDTEAALHTLLQAISLAGLRPGQDVFLALDAAASGWKTDTPGRYRLPKSGREYTAAQLIERWASLGDTFPLISLEDGLDEDDWPGWQQLTDEVGGRMQLVGDDLFVTNLSRLERGLAGRCANAILIKPNQIGTLTETAAVVRRAQKAGLGVMLSHRSGETADPLIADLAVGLGAGQIKSGAPCRSERCAKYNRLLEIEAALGSRAVWPGKGVYPALHRTD